ncbi:MAG: ketosynthase [Stenotrophomonas koreensis]|jgi:hypothetical protein|uniref:ketosynthase n=1 Tax=Stenotrophomonas koreensis TaxID=266128 RepID=UPI0033984DCF
MPPVPAPGAPLTLRLSLVLVYPLLCHLASTGTPLAGAWAALALASLLAWCLLDGLWQRQLAAWLWMLGSAAALAMMAGSAWAWTLLLAPPVVFPLWVAWLFARTLRAGRTPLILRIVHAVHARAGMPVEAPLVRYISQLTAAWALVLVLLAAINAVLALSVVPDGPLMAAGVQPWWPVTHIQWAWLANVANWSLLGGFALLEYGWRMLRFPQRPDRNLLHFGRLLAGLGPAFWRDLLR